MKSECADNDVNSGTKEKKGESSFCARREVRVRRVGWTLVRNKQSLNPFEVRGMWRRQQAGSKVQVPMAVGRTSLSPLCNSTVSPHKQLKGEEYVRHPGK